MKYLLILDEKKPAQGRLGLEKLYLLSDVEQKRQTVEDDEI